MRPYYSIFMGYLRKMRENQQSELPHLYTYEHPFQKSWIHHWIENIKGADQTGQMRRLVCIIVVPMHQSQVFSCRGPYKVLYTAKIMRSSNLVVCCSCDQRIDLKVSFIFLAKERAYVCESPTRARSSGSRATSTFQSTVSCQ